MGLKKLLLAMLVCPFMASPAWADNTVNVNTASIKELQKVDGIDVKTAAKIIAYRNEYGPFEYVDDLLHIKGIDKHKLARVMNKLSATDAMKNKAAH